MRPQLIGGKRKYECFDAFAKVADIFTLCDGANSCESSGKLATELARSFSEKVSFLDQKLLIESMRYQE